ncbi:MAG TPA: helix-turn-helix transcriptional regulator [Caulobacteraceae bacterium]|nr:helix-turn-helix transcriptional regulator [Caulobacteraceae bacterium]
MTLAANPSPQVGDHIRVWRRRRRMSQMDLALDAEISTRHLSFVETGRAAPSRRMILTLAERLEIPKRERNVLLVAGGYAPVFPERALDAPEMQPARDVIDLVLNGHLPYPAFAIDRQWNILSSNRSLPKIYEGVAEELLAPPVNALRLTLHPKGMAARVLNLEEWRANVLARLRAQIASTADPGLAELYAELRSYSDDGGDEAAEPRGAPLIPFRLATEVGPLSFLTTTMVFDAPVDVTLSELMVECFFPADPETRERVKLMSADA